MSQWEDKLNSHAIHTTITNLAERLNDKDLEIEDLSAIELIDKIVQVKSYTEICLQNVIPALVNQAHLNNANSNLQKVLNELNSYIANKNIAHLNNSTNHVDAVMTQLNALPIPNNTIRDDSFTESLTQFKVLIERSFSEITTLKDELKDSISKVTEDSLEQKDNIDNLASNIQGHHENIESSLTEFNQRFEDFEKQFQAKLDINISEGNDQLSEIIINQQVEHDTRIKEQRESASEIIKTLKEKKKDASDLVQIIGNIGITGNYQNIANQEKTTADRWRNIALSLMIGMVAAIAITIGITTTEGFDWKLALFRISAALVLAIPATYAAKESTKHRTLENYNRKAELELASLDPFLEKLPEEIRHKVKEGLTDKFFGMSISEQNPDEPVSYSALYDLLKTVITKK
jgi:predicted CopG family antitoxin